MKKVTAQIDPVWRNKQPESHQILLGRGAVTNFCNIYLGSSLSTWLQQWPAEVTPVVRCLCSKVFFTLSDFLPHPLCWKLQRHTTKWNAPSHWANLWISAVWTLLETFVIMSEQDSTTYRANIMSFSHILMQNFVPIILNVFEVEPTTRDQFKKLPDSGRYSYSWINETVYVNQMFAACSLTALQSGGEDRRRQKCILLTVVSYSREQVSLCMTIKQGCVYL